MFFKSNLIFFQNNFQIIWTKYLSTLRTSTVLNISKKFKNISLVDFPLIKPEKFNLSDYSEIENAHFQCCTCDLDNNPNYYPSVTTILSKTMPPESLAALKKWEDEKIKYNHFY